ncbi:sigma-70 family RNA polymerase sigma factor [Streptomyces sp. NPDC058646]|uniref:sigma-70 family RNA polymerase sigma factor n=1 Tax=Streptomyces sp. NPDC058646 TaxID=3346574 RepID=UPI00364EBA35
MTGDSGYEAARFEEKRGHLRAVAYRMLGSLSEAEDAVQEAWIRLDRSDPGDVGNLGGWLTTVVSRVCLDQLRSRKARGEESLDGPAGFPEPLLSPPDGLDPEQEVLLADSVGLALLVVLEQLAPAERLSFVLHDMFGVPFDEIAPIVERPPAAARQPASRARRRVQGGAPAPDADTGRQKETALVNGVPGLVAISPEGRALAVMGMTVSGGRIVATDILADPGRLEGVGVTALDQQDEHFDDRTEDRGPGPGTRTEDED